MEVTSIGSTESDPKEKDDIFCFETILESSEVIEEEEVKGVVCDEVIEEVSQEGG